MVEYLLGNGRESAQPPVEIRDETRLRGGGYVMEKGGRDHRPESGGGVRMRHVVIGVLIGVVAFYAVIVGAILLLETDALRPYIHVSTAKEIIP